MAFEIDIPEELGDKNLVPFFKGWSWLDDPPSPVILRVHGSHLAPWAATLFGAYGIWLREVRNKEVILEYDASTYVGHFLEQIGLPQLLGKELPDIAADERRVFPLTRIGESKQIATVSTAIAGLLMIDDEEVGGAVKYS